jgi:HK97 family phage major capsid protein
MKFSTRYVLWALAAIACALMVAFDASAGVMLAAVAAVTEDDLADLGKKLRDAKAGFEKATEEVKEVGKTFAEKLLAGEKADQELTVKVDEALGKQGELSQQIRDLEQAVAKGFKAAGDGPGDPLEVAFQKAIDENPAVKSFLTTGPERGQTINIAIDRKALTNSGVTGAALNYPGDQVLAAPLQPLLRRLTVRDLLMPGRTSKSVIFYPRESGYTNNAAPVSEGSLKPKSDITMEIITDPVRTIAHLQDISLQMLDDVPYILSYIRGRMIYGLKLKEEDQLLNGSGTGQNLNGLYTQATAYLAATYDALVGAGIQDIDKLRLAMLQVEVAYANATGIVLNPINWAGIELLKDTQGRYLFTNPQNTTTGRLWGRDVVSTQAMTQGRFLVGDFAGNAQILDRQDANVAISYENKDNFERNMATIRVEERLALADYRPEAFVKGTLESASH